MVGDRKENGRVTDRADDQPSSLLTKVEDLLKIEALHLARRPPVSFGLVYLDAEVNMATVVIPDAERRLGALGSVLIPILQQLSVPNGQMVEFSFVVSLNGRNMTLHKSSCTRLPKTRIATKH